MPGWSCWNCPALCSGAHRWARPLVVLCSVLVRSAGRRRFFLTLSCTQLHDCVPSPRQRWHTSGNPLPLSSGGVAALSCRLIRSSFDKRRQETAAPGSGTAASCYLSHFDHLPSGLLPQVQNNGFWEISHKGSIGKYEERQRNIAKYDKFSFILVAIKTQYVSNSPNSFN